MKRNLLIFLKGILMGICDIIPGISGGTIAFITGIYERLINAVKNISPQLVKDFFSYASKRDAPRLSHLKASFRKVDIIFLVILGLGIGTALLIGSRLISFLLENYFVYTISFFIGLIIASSKIIFDHIEKHHTKNIILGFVGLLLGFLLAVLIPVSVTPTYGYVFLGGFLAISAMFLPGISGAFILLILGLYEFMLGVLHDILGQFLYFIVFGVGAGFGAFSISRIISFLFAKDKAKTLYVLLGLVVGALSIPIKRVYEAINIWNFSSLSIILAFVILGVVSVFLVARFERFKKK